MPTTTKTPIDDVTRPELPNGWGWWSGEKSPGYYTVWFGTEYKMGGNLAGKHGMGGYQGEIYWDHGGDHHVHIYPVTGTTSKGDPIVDEYPVASGTFDTAEEAFEAVPELIDSL